MSTVPRWELVTNAHSVGSPQSGKYVIWSYALDALLQSENHPRNPKTGAYVGVGPFFVHKTRVLNTGHDFNYSLYNGLLRYNYTMAGVCCGPTGYPNVAAIQSAAHASYADSKSALNGAYATGYSRARPGNPQASVAQFIAEMRDLPQIPFRNALFNKRRGRRFATATPFVDIPKRLRERSLNMRSLGSEYLNVVFGWKPFVSDLRKMYNLWQVIDKKMAQLYRENGKLIRRKATISDEKTVEQGPSFSELRVIAQGKSTEVSDPNLSNPAEGRQYTYPFAQVWGNPGASLPGSSLYTVTRVTEDKKWFSSKWKYHLPNLPSSQWSKGARAMLFGAVPTPETVWELMPWSWLIDWFTNMGDVVSNVSPNAVGYPVLFEGCAMHHRKETLIYRTDSQVLPARPEWGQSWKEGSFQAQTKHSTETKTRITSGNPFGLNVKLESLSAYQFAILAALGISRGKVK